MQLYSLQQEDIVKRLESIGSSEPEIPHFFITSLDNDVHGLCLTGFAGDNTGSLYRYGSEVLPSFTLSRGLYHFCLPGSVSSADTANSFPAEDNSHHATFSKVIHSLGHIPNAECVPGHCVHRLAPRGDWSQLQALPATDSLWMWRSLRGTQLYSLQWLCR